jgi:Haem-degrading
MRFHLNSTATSAAVLASALALGAVQARTAQADCKDLPSHADLQAALIAANTAVDLTLNNEMWGTIVAEDGTVCAVAHTGADNLQSQWLASRVISAQKANTANSLSLGQNDGGTNSGLALSTANLWAAVQPGGSLFGLQHSNPVDPAVAYKGPSSRFGKSNDPMVGKLIGGVNVFGGGLALYNEAGDRVGGVGVSGDTSCRDHMVAWETRHNLGLDFVTAGVSGDPERPDNIIFDVENAFGHPNCLDPDNEADVAASLTAVP